MDIVAAWTDFKSVVNQKNLSVQYITVGANYYLSAADGPFIVNCIITTDPTNSDTNDFLTNYQSTGNALVKSTVTPEPFIDNVVSGTFTGAGQTIQISTAGCSTLQYYTSGTWVGTIITEVAYDTAGTIWVPTPTVDTDPGTNLLLTTWGNDVINAFNNDPWEVNVSASTFFRLRVVDYTSGSLTVNIISSTASSDTSEPPSDRWSAGQISALNGNQFGSTSGCAACGIGITGTWAGTLTFQASIDNVNFFTIPVIDVATGFQVTTTTTNGNYTTPCGGYNMVQVTMTSYTSGTATIAFDAGEGSNSDIFPIDYPTQYINLIGNATTTIKSGAGRLHCIMINNNATAGTVTIYDNTTAAGTKIATLTIGSPTGGLISGTGQQGPVSLNGLAPNGLTFNTGLTVVTAGSTNNDITLIYQ